MCHVVVTLHAHRQYCARVGEISYAELNKYISGRYKARQWTYNKDQFVEIDGVWWVKQHEGETVHFITCYGKSHFDVPAALVWAARHKDRLVFDSG